MLKIRKDVTIWAYMAYISELKLHNFKSFHDQTFLFDPGINYLVGDNNCGKTTVFSAIQFIVSGKDKNDFKSKDKIGAEEYFSVEMTLAGGDLKEYLESSDNRNLKKYIDYLEESDGLYRLKICRSSKVESTEDGKIQLDLSKVRIINPKTGGFVAPTGIDATISALFDTQLVLADEKSNDYFDLKQTKLCGKLIKALVKPGQIKEWEELKVSHSKAFEAINKQLDIAQVSITNRLKEQYSDDVEAKFSFEIPDITDLMSNGTISLKESGVETTSSEKGTGMQRALVLAVMQTYSELVKNSGIEKPTFFLLDEPETFLHPKAQGKLLEALGKISESSQIFITTHSPYLLTKYKPKENALIVFAKRDGHNTVRNDHELDLFGNSSPTWGEINYRAFGIYTETFHDELYGFLQAIAAEQDSENGSEKWFSSFLQEHGITEMKDWIREKKGVAMGPEPLPLPVYIRNYIHHPENRRNVKYTEDELRRSIEQLRMVYLEIKD